MSYARSLRCRKCGREYPLEPINLCNFCLSPLEVNYDYKSMAEKVSREKLAEGQFTMWRYRDMLPAEGEVVDNINCLLIDSGTDKILIDTGCGDGFQSTAGFLVRNLEAEGIRCSDIDRIIITHGHIDHVSGSFSSKGEPVFPDARFVTTEKEWECWVTRPEKNELQTSSLC